MFQWSNIELNEEHRRNLLRQAESERLACVAQAAPKSSSPLYASLLAEIRSQLGQLVKSLQAENAPAKLKPEL